MTILLESESRRVVSKHIGDGFGIETAFQCQCGRCVTEVVKSDFRQRSVSQCLLEIPSADIVRRERFAVLLTEIIVVLVPKERSFNELVGFYLLKGFDDFGDRWTGRALQFFGVPNIVSGL